MSKGQTGELIELLIVVVGVSVSLIISYYLFVSGTPRVSTLLSEEHTTDRIADATNAFYYTKIGGTDRTLSQLIADRLATGTNPVTYGQGFGNIDVDNQTTIFFDSYFQKNWRLEIRPPGTITVGMIVDTTTNATQSLEKIKQELPTIVNDIGKTGREFYIDFYLLPGPFANCQDLQGVPQTTCSILSADQCSLEGQQSGDWGNGVACIVNYYNPNTVIVISDESPAGCEFCLQTYSPNMGPIGDDSLLNGINAVKKANTKVFSLSETFDCASACSGDPNYCNNCDQCCVANAHSAMKKIAEDNGGKYFELNGQTDPGEIMKTIIEGIPINDIKLGYSTPGGITRLQTFEILIPLPTISNRLVKGILYVW